MRELVYYVAASLDGFIAETDGSFSSFPYDEDYGSALAALYPETFPAHLRQASPPSNAETYFDTVLMGRRTYEVALNAGVRSPYGGLEQYVFSKSLPDDDDSGVRITRDDPDRVVQDLKAQPGRAIWLCGGAQLAGALHDAGLIDRVIVKLNPVLLGRGLPLFACASAPPRPLRLQDKHAFPSGHMILDYAILA